MYGQWEYTFPENKRISNHLVEGFGPKHWIHLQYGAGRLKPCLNCACCLLMLFHYFLVEPPPRVNPPSVAIWAAWSARVNKIVPQNLEACLVGWLELRLWGETLTPVSPTLLQRAPHRESSGVSESYLLRWRGRSLAPSVVPNLESPWLSRILTRTLLQAWRLRMSCAALCSMVSNLLYYHEAISDPSASTWLFTEVPW